MVKSSCVNIKESDICKKFVRDVEKLKAYGMFKTDFDLIHIANERVHTGNRIRDISYLKHLVAMGMLPGAPDYFVVYKGGRIAAIEFKRDKSGLKLKGNQLVFKERAHALDIPYLCTYDVQEGIDFLIGLFNNSEGINA